MEKKKSKISINAIIFWLAILSLILSLIYYFNVYKQADIKNVLPLAIPQATNFQEINSDPLTFRAYEGSNLIGFCTLGEASGYQSQIEMLVSVDLNGIITNVIVYNQSETQSFFYRLIDEEFFSQFLNQNIKDGFILDEDIDAVTGSTVSSLAVTKAVNEAITYIGEKELQMDHIKNPYDEIVFGYREIFLLCILAFSILSIYINTRKIRPFILLFSVIVLGFMYDVFITNSSFATLLTGQIPSFVNIYWWIFIPLIIVIVFFSGKNIFFNWICPFGAFQELLNNFASIKSFKPSTKVDNWARKLPALLTWFALILAFLYGNPNIATFEPFASFFSQIGTGIQWFLLVIVVFSNFIIKRFWCRYFCPVGYIMFFISRLKRKGVRLWKRVRNGRTIFSSR